MNKLKSFMMFCVIFSQTATYPPFSCEAAGIATSQAALSSANYNNPYDSDPESRCLSDSSVLFCDDWDHDAYRDLVDLDLTWDWGTSDNAGYSPNSGLNCSGVGYNSSCALQVTIAQDQPETIYPRHVFPEQGIKWTYARFCVKFDANFQFYPSQDGAQKIAYLESNLNSDGYWRVELGAGRKDTTNTGWWFYDVNTHNEPGAHTCNSNPLCAIVPNAWYAVEMGILPNTAKGVADGALRLWVNGNLVLDEGGIDMKKTPTGLSTDDGFDTFWISAYYGGPTVNHPTMKLWYDNIIIATQPIGLVGGATPPPLDITPPSSPRGLGVR